MARCSKCGAEVPGRFCPECGTEAPASQPPTPPVAAANQSYAPVPPAYGQYPPQPYGASPEKPRSIWQGIVTLIVMLLVSAFVLLGLSAVEGADVATAKVGAIAVMVVVGLIGLSFGIWSLVANRVAGKVMAGIGLAVWALSLVLAIAW